jgi:hypothetical protein
MVPFEVIGIGLLFVQDRLRISSSAGAIASQLKGAGKKHIIKL